ncbi:MAG: 2TM domain-containing protein [Actinomycetota bacterium]|nr:2TM domain-containing protein [Actinomycetota bacterium]
MKRIGKAKEPPSADALRARAEKRVKSRTTGLWLLYNIGSFVLINGLLIAIWAISDSDYPWFLWVLLIWAGTLAFQFAGYVMGFRHGASRERMIEEQMATYVNKEGRVGDLNQAAGAESLAGEGQQASPASSDDQPAGE